MIKRIEVDIPVVILCGGRGVRLAPLTEEIPKPLVTIGKRPILWHVMNIYASYGFRRFILCLGYKAHQVKDYFIKNNEDNWDITLVDTGIDSSKSQRLLKIKNLIREKLFFLAYGDDVADINIQNLLKLHIRSNVLATVTAVNKVSDYGVMEIGRENLITNFKEKPRLNLWVNAGFMVLQKKMFDFLKNGELESVIFSELARRRKICAYRHKGQWCSMNTLKDYIELNKLWQEGGAFWKVWK